jgi:hypothetical protein
MQKSHWEHCCGAKGVLNAALECRVGGTRYRLSTGSLVCDRLSFGLGFVTASAPRPRCGEPGHAVATMTRGTTIE